jgi:hypothetical protein
VCGLASMHQASEPGPTTTGHLAPLFRQISYLTSAGTSQNRSRELFIHFRMTWHILTPHLRRLSRRHAGYRAGGSASHIASGASRAHASSCTA